MARPPTETELREVTLLLGFSGARAALQALVAASGAAAPAAAAAARYIAALEPPAGEGCLRVELPAPPAAAGAAPGAEQAPRVAILALGPCAREHSLGLELDKLQAAVAPAQWAAAKEQLLRHLSLLLHVGRVAFALLAREHLARVRALLGADPGAPVPELRVDPAASTLMLDPDWPGRVGILVTVEAGPGPAEV